MMNKKHFACIMTAKEDMQKIVEMGQDLKVTNAYKTAQAMLEVAQKFMNDFGDCDPHWNKNTAAKPEAAVETPAEAPAEVPAE